MAKCPPFWISDYVTGNNNTCNCLKGALLALLVFSQLGHDNVVEDSGWYVEKVEVDMPTKGKHFSFACRCWLAKDKSGGKTSHVFKLGEDETSVVSYRPSEQL